MACAITIPLNDLTNKQSKIVAIAREAAEQSDMLYRHGSVAVSNGRVLAKGCNHYRNKLRDRVVLSFHSEIDVLSSVFRGTAQPTRHTSNAKFKGQYVQGAKVQETA